MDINASGLDYRRLNERIHKAHAQGIKNFVLKNVCGQRYICAGVKGNLSVRIEGVPGNDLGAFMDGPSIEVAGNSQDAIANTMNSGRIAIHGHAGDVLAYGMRGGKLFVRDSVGYRVGIHMKAFKSLVPVLVIGGTAKGYLGEYMAGGVIIVLALDDRCSSPAGFCVGSGAHGGAIYVRGKLRDEQLGKEIRRAKLNSADHSLLREYIADFCRTFRVKHSTILKSRFSKYIPLSHRPYGKIYAY
jgi:glutamate synthase domain-containing protein 3